MQKLGYATIYFVRHGQTDWNEKHLIQGHTDRELTITGQQQAENLQETFKDIHFDVVFSSDLQRAKRTAEIATLERKIAIETTEVLRERNFGSLEGSRREEFFKLENLRRSLAKEQRLEYRLVPNMENDEEIIGRIIQFLREVAVAYTGKTVLIVSHGGVMYTLLDHLGFSTEDHPVTYIENTAYIKLRSDGVNFFIDETKGITKD